MCTYYTYTYLCSTLILDAECVRMCVAHISFANNITRSMLLLLPCCCLPALGLAHFRETYKSRFQCAQAHTAPSLCAVHEHRAHNTCTLTIHDTHSLVTYFVRMHVYTYIYSCTCVLNQLLARRRPLTQRVTYTNNYIRKPIHARALPSFVSRAPSRRSQVQ